MTDLKALSFRPLTEENWDDFEQLFCAKGASGGCWCMLWRTSPKEFKAQKGDGNCEAMRRLAGSARALGIFAYDAETPIAWCAIAPREEYPVEPDKENYPAVHAWVGLAKTFTTANFEECARRSTTRPIMRRKLES